MLDCRVSRHFVSFCRELFLFALSFSYLPLSFSFCRGLFLFAVVFFYLPWAFSICRQLFLFAVSFFYLPWQLWATVPNSRGIGWPIQNARPEKQLGIKNCFGSKAWILIYWSSRSWILSYWSSEFLIDAQRLRFSQIQTYFKKCSCFKTRGSKACQGLDSTILYPL